VADHLGLPRPTVRSHLRLVALGLQVRAAEVSVPPAAAELKWELAGVADGLMDVLRDVREISRAGSTR
jgi:hypothetical protein